MNIKIIATIVLALGQFGFAEPFRVSWYENEKNVVPQRFVHNLTSDKGKQYLQNPSELLLSDLKKEAEQGSANAYFDMAVIYFLGVGVQKNNQTAKEDFMESYKLSDDFDVAASNADWIQYGPPRRKDVGDLAESMGRVLQGRIIWVRDWLLYLGELPF